MIALLVKYTPTSTETTAMPADTTEAMVFASIGVPLTCSNPQTSKTQPEKGPAPEAIERDTRDGFRIRQPQATERVRNSTDNGRFYPYVRPPTANPCGSADRPSSRHAGRTGPWPMVASSLC